MKQNNLLLIALTIASGSAVAQETTEKLLAEVKTDYRDNLMFGLKAGTNYANVYDAQGEEFDNDAKFGFAGGLFLSIPIGKFLGVHPEIMYSQKGFHATGRILGSTYDFTRTTNYIDVPIFVAIKPSKYVTVVAGPQYSYLLSQKDAFATGSTSATQITEFNNDNINKNILSVAGGLDVNVRHAVFGARVSWDITNNNGNGTSTTPRYKNTYLQATIGYRL